MLGALVAEKALQVTGLNGFTCRKRLLTTEQG